MKYCSLIIFFLYSAVGSHCLAANQYQNVVIGQGCASTCIDGKCESSCDEVGGNRNVITREYDYSDFSVIEIDGLDSIVKFGEKYSVSLTDTESAFDKIRLSVITADEKALLSVTLDDGYKSVDGGKVEITVPKLTSLRLSGNANSDIQGFDQEQIDIELSGNTELSGSKNQFESMVLSANENSDVDLHKSWVARAEISVTGSADVLLNFKPGGEVKGVVSGMSDVKLCGSPEQKLSVSSMADITSISCSK